MDRLNEIYQELYDDGVFFHAGNYNLDGGCDSVIVSDGTHYGIFLDIEKIRTPVQEKMAVSHEWGHYVTGSTYAMDASELVRRSSELRAEKAQIKRLIPKWELEQAVASGITELWELAEHFSVTEEFMEKAAFYYIHGCHKP